MGKYDNKERVGYHNIMKRLLLLFGICMIFLIALASATQEDKPIHIKYTDKEINQLNQKTINLTFHTDISCDTVYCYFNLDGKEMKFNRTIEKIRYNKVTANNSRGYRGQKEIYYRNITKSEMYDTVKNMSTIYLDNEISKGNRVVMIKNQEIKIERVTLLDRIIRFLGVSYE